MARETLASKQAIIDAQTEELTELRKLLPLSADDVRGIVREMMHTDEGEEFVREIAAEAVDNAFDYDLDYKLRDIVDDAVSDRLFSIDPQDIGAAEEDHSHEVR